MNRITQDDGQVFILFHTGGKKIALWATNPERKAGLGPIVFATSNDAELYLKRLSSVTAGYRVVKQPMSSLTKNAAAEGWTMIWSVRWEGDEGSATYAGATIPKAA